MKIQKIAISNFRGIRNISFEPDQNVNVFVGPNAIGKTTLLEAIRLAKSLLSPRFFQEAQQTLISLGALSPHFQVLGPQGLDFQALAHDTTKSLEILIELQLSANELANLAQNTNQIGVALLRNSLGQADDQSQLALSQYLSSQPGQHALEKATNEAKEQIEALNSTKKLKLNLIFSPNEGFRGTDAFSQSCISLLEQMLPPYLCLFSYFPADRAFPAGDVNIQIGGGDINAQIHSHFSQAATKYQRLKQTIIQGIITGQFKHEELAKDFAIILKTLLPGKELAAINTNQIGLFKVLIRELSSGKVFDIDSMSSGEKGLILTFLLLRKTIHTGGILLIDEPELHLNQAVCGKLLPFLIEHCLEANDIQAFICTHSPEILGSAYERDDSNLFHLRSGTDLTRIYPRDHSEMFEALRRLGASTADVLFTRGSIFVEGEHDVEILNEGFFDVISGYKIDKLGGRNEVQKEIRQLLSAQDKGKVDRLNVFIFDMDNRPVENNSKGLIRVTQWDRYCLENFLLDEKIIYDVVLEHAEKKPESRGAFKNILKDIATRQLKDQVIQKIYSNLEPDNPGLRPNETRGKEFADAGAILFERLAKIRQSLQGIDALQWVGKFTEECNRAYTGSSEEWERDWGKMCDGKRLIDELYKEFEIRYDKLSLKKKIVRLMRQEKTDNWRLIHSRISEALRI